MPLIKRQSCKIVLKKIVTRPKNEIVLWNFDFLILNFENLMKIIVKRGASSRWSFRPNSSWGSMETTTINTTIMCGGAVLLVSLAMSFWIEVFFISVNR